MIRDYIVVGQGLAGSILSYYLIQHNCSVLVYDDPSGSKSSLVAAGIFNPFTGRKLVKTWMADQLFPFLKEFYKKLQSDIETEVLHRIPMYRPFVSREEQNQWGARSHEEGYSHFIDSLISPTQAYPQFINPLGGMMLKNSGYVDIPRLIKGVSNFLSQRDSLRREKFEESKLEVYKDYVSYQGIKSRKLIFCDGPELRDSKFFGWLPLTPVKGEILNIKMDMPLEFIVNRGVFVLPIGDNVCKVGATFDHKDLSLSTTDQAKQQLIKKLDNLVRIPYSVISQFAGIRPASSDRRPFIGLHPEFEPLGVFNGLGTKG
ncbi:MAG: NAD(P)/FAD-dependent oxidoreductase, partial [Aurantibacter sp.]